MVLPTCPDHKTLVRDLALGLLSDSETERAELLRQQCTHCRDWWETTFGGDAANTVGTSVEAVFDRFEVPQRTRSLRWLPLAAAAVLALAIGLVMQAPTPESPDSAISSQGTLLFEASWEQPLGGVGEAQLVGQILSGPSAMSSSVPREDSEREDASRFFVESLESSDLSGWSSSG